MDDADLLRNRATRLFALAERARQQGHPDYADELSKLAREVVGHLEVSHFLTSVAGLILLFAAYGLYLRTRRRLVARSVHDFA